MKKRLLKIGLLISAIAGIIYLNNGFNHPFRFFSNTAQAVGDLTVNWGVPEGDPIFIINNMAPGDSETRTVDITNNASSIRPIGVRGLIATESGNLSTVMDIVISQSGTPLYGTGSPTGPKTLAQFFTESAGIDGIPLFDLAPSTSTSIDFIVTFDPNAGNEFQDREVIFDLKIGIAIDIPDQCEGLPFSGDPIFGTDGDDNIKGTNKNDLIIAFEGNDIVKSSNGNDCVIGGPGNDKINNSNGHDFIFGNEGDDELNGSNGNDFISGGPDNDKIKASNGNDTIFGDEGDDNIEASNDNDIVMGGPGNDFVDAGNGDDQVNGEEGNDNLRGRNGKDTLIGGPDTDTTDGGLGLDACDGEIETACEL